MRQRKETTDETLSEHVHPPAGHLPPAGVSPAAAVERPMALTGSGNATLNPDGSGGTTIASGTATHLGKWTEEGVLTFTATSDPNLILANGEGTFTATDGDQLFTTITDAVLDLTTGIATGAFVFVGGTGRFEGASGSIDFVVNQDPAGPFDVTAVGTIDF